MPEVSMLFWGRKLFAALLLPPAGPTLLIACGLLIWHRHARAGRILAWLGVALQLLLMLPLTVYPLAGAMIDAPVHPSPDTAQAIVVIGAGRRQYAPEFGAGPTLSAPSLERVRYAAWLARQTGLPLLVSGGAPDGGGASESTLMRRVLEEEFRVPVRWVEENSRDTRENARLSAHILQDAGIHRILLVTHALHMHRASENFRMAGLEVTPAPTARPSPAVSLKWPQALIPDPQSSYTGWFAMHEWLARLAEPLRGASDRR